MSKWRVFTVLAIMLISTLHRSSGSVSVGANIGIPDLFEPSSQYHYVKQSYPYYLDEYQYRQLSMDKNYFDDEDEDELVFELGEVGELDEIDRQVGGPGVVDNGGQLFGDLTPLLFTSALVVGLSAVFNNVVTLNSTASNASVPFGLWALPELPFFPNLTLPGRKRRSLRGDNLDNFLDNQEDLLGEDFKSEIIDKMFGDLIAKNFKNAVRTMALMENTQCQAALGCRYGQMLNAKEDNWNVISYILTLLRPLEWDVFTEVFEKVSKSHGDQAPIDCSMFHCEECLRLPW